MRMKTKLYTLALGAFFVPAMLVAGCGGVPGNAVAEVDGTAIEKNDFEHWLNVAAKSGGQAGAAAPKPPSYEACVNQKRKTTPKPAKGQPKVTDAQLKTQCKQEYNALRDQVLQLLISFEWIEGEAQEQNIKVSDAEVKKSFDTQKKEAFPKDADFDKFLKDSGQTEEDILQRVRLDTLSNKIREKVTKGKDKVTDAQIEEYYDKNKQRFAQPERRDLRIVLTKTKAKAEQAKAALEDGESFKSVAKKYSIDQASKAQGGKLPAVAKGQQEKALDEAIFKAKKGELVGPVKTQFGYYVFEVTRSRRRRSRRWRRPRRRSSRCSPPRTSRRRWTASSRTSASVEGEDGLPRGLRTQDCKNAPKATPTPDRDGARRHPAAPQPAQPTATPEGS